MDFVRKYSDKLGFKIGFIDELCSIPHSVAPSLKDKLIYLKKERNIKFKVEELSRLDYLHMAEYVSDVDFYFLAREDRTKREVFAVENHRLRDILFYTIYQRDSTLENIDFITKQMKPFGAVPFLGKYGISDKEWIEMRQFIFSDFKKRVAAVMKKNVINDKVVSSKEVSILNKIMKTNIK